MWHLDAQGNESFHHYDVSGKRLGSYRINVYNHITISYTDPSVAATNVYFGSKIIVSEGRTVILDRLGSVRLREVGCCVPFERVNYFPYGEGMTSAARNFATYERSPSTGVDYADQRYYSGIQGRFLSPDPYVASAGVGEPGSWNRYVYTRGDPVNRYDPRGLQDEGPPLDLSWFVQRQIDQLRQQIFDPEDPARPPENLPDVHDILQSSTRWGREWALEALKAINKNCKTDLDRTVEEGKSGTLGFFILRHVQTMSLAVSWDGNHMNMTMADLPGPGTADQRTVRQYLVEGGVDLSNPAVSGAYLGGNVVMVTNGGARTNIEAAIALIHESIHLTFSSHTDAAKMITGRSYGGDMAASGAIDEWLRECITGN